MKMHGSPTGLLLFVVVGLFAFAAVGRAQECHAGGVREDCCPPGSPCAGASECEARGCCWSPMYPPNECSTSGTPYCFKPNPALQGYAVKTVRETDYGIEASLGLIDGKNLFGEDIATLQMSAYFDTETRLHVKIYDPNNARWEVPRVALTGLPAKKAATTEYRFSYTTKPFGFAVSRRATGEVLFNTTTTGVFNGLVFEDQYLEISTQLSPNANLYGIGEHVKPLRLNTTGFLYTLWANGTHYHFYFLFFVLDPLSADHNGGSPAFTNMYGSHPFYMELRSTGAHGVFLLNSNGMDVYSGPEQLTYRTIGGILDFYFFVGPSPAEVISQYTEVIGKPFMPSYWTLGFHQCRWGYRTLEEVKNVVSNYSSHNIPLDTMWIDIDYMDQYRDYTWDPVRFPVAEVKRFADKLHANGQHFVVIDDCGIPNVTSYAPYEQGLELDIFIKQNNGKDPYIGKVWPGSTAWPDFFHPDSDQYWSTSIKGFLSTVPVDGLWTDMNEPANFCDGYCDGEAPKRATSGAFDPNYPPYAINNRNCRMPLWSHTVPQDLKLYNTIEYNGHNMYGITEANSTSHALQTLRGKRPFVLSRSTFPGHGRRAAHWLGDNYSTWDDLYYAIPGILAFNMFGVPLVGADICGFSYNTTEELCARWMEVGAFYPFSRNHNAVDMRSQEPYVWPTVAAISRSVLRTRYSLLPYYYTHFFLAHTNGSTVARPLLFEFPSDPETWDIDRQFLIGGHLLISPVLEQGATSVRAYFPGELWYDYFTHAPATNGKATWLTLRAPLDTIPVHVRGGGIIPWQAPELTTTATRKNPYSLIVALSLADSASGLLYIDDGDSIDPVERGAFTLMSYRAVQTPTYGQLESIALADNYVDAQNRKLDSVTVMGVKLKPNKAAINGKHANFNWNPATLSVVFTSLNTPINANFTLVWSYS